MITLLSAVCVVVICAVLYVTTIGKAHVDPNMKPIVWVEFGDWKGVWCRAEYMNRIRKSWEVVPWDAQTKGQNPRSQQYRTINTDALPKAGKIRATINGGEFKCDDANNAPAVSMGAVLSKGKLVVGSSVIKNSLMTEGIVAFNSTGSDIYMDTLDGRKADQAKGPYADTAFKRTNTPYLSLIRDKSNLQKKKLIKPLFGPYQHGKLAHFMLMHNGKVIPKAGGNTTGHASSRTIIVLGKPRQYMVREKDGKRVTKRGRDLLLLVNHNTDKGCLIDEVRQFIDNLTSAKDASRGVLRQELNKMLKSGGQEFSIDSVMMLDGGSSSQVHYSDHLTSHHYGNITDDVRLSPRPIPDYIRLEADWE